MKYLKTWQIFENNDSDIKQYIQEKGYKPNTDKYKKFLYHGTYKNPNDFKLDPDLDWVDVVGNGSWDFDMPDGVLFLSNSILEAKVYGSYIIPFELDTDDILTIKVDSDNPSNLFDEDYNYGTKYNLYQRFTDEAECLEIKGNTKSTFICYIGSSLIPRLDIAKEFYNK